MEKKLSLVTILVLGLFSVTSGFPDGGPVDACVKPQPNRPYHGQTKAQPIQTNPYVILASKDRYEPGQQITGQ